MKSGIELIRSLFVRTSLIATVLGLFLESSFAADQITDWTIEVGEEGYVGLREIKSPYSTYTYVFLGSFEFSVDLPLPAVLFLALILIGLVVGLASFFWARQARKAG